MQCIESVKEWTVSPPNSWESFACLSDGPDACLVFVGGCQTSALPPEARVLIYAPDFFLTDPEPWYTFERVFSIPRALLLESLGVQVALRRKWSEPDFASFRADFESLSEAFRQKQLKKGVPVVFKESLGPVGRDERLALLANMLRNSQGYPQDVYALWHKERGIVGVTPERLFHEDAGGSIHSMAVAGTRLHQDRDQEGVLGLLEDPKERAEHQWVIESIVDSLSVIGSVTVGKTDVRELAHLSHLVTPLGCEPFQAGALNGESFAKLIHLLHPTAALGAFPKEPGWKWLQARAHAKRHWFGGPFGIFGPGAVLARALVMIRNVQWDGTALRLGAGCGVIQESRIEKEWDEILGKMRAVAKTFSSSGQTL